MAGYIPSHFFNPFFFICAEKAISICTIIPPRLSGILSARRDRVTPVWLPVLAVCSQTRQSSTTASGYGSAHIPRLSFSTGGRTPQTLRNHGLLLHYGYPPWNQPWASQVLQLRCLLLAGAAPLMTALLLRPWQNCSSWVSSPLIYLI